MKDNETYPYKWLRQPIFLLGCHKSGTSLLRSLLDGHPELYVYPRETHFFQLSGFWVAYALRHSRYRKLNYDDFIENCVRELEAQNASADPHSDNPGFSEFNSRRFQAFMQRHSPENRREVFEVYLAALQQAVGAAEPMACNMIVEKSVENAEYASTLRSMFPDCRFIHIVRHPYATINAIRRAKAKTGRYPLMVQATRSLNNSSYFLLRNRDTLGSYAVIKYEDLVSATKETMTRICSFLEIDFTPELLVPTSLGESWLGNSTSNQKLIGISTSRIDAWRREITELEIHLANVAAEPIFDEYGYDRRWANWRRYLPIPREEPLVYLRNRSLFWSFQ